jgi:hypothetical protein
MRLKKGDLVACYVTNSEVYESLMSWGLVLDINASTEDVYVLDNIGHAQWWPSKRWRLLKEK